jgi:hypothetical protein
VTSIRRERKKELKRRERSKDKQKSRTWAWRHNSRHCARRTISVKLYPWKPCTAEKDYKEDIMSLVGSLLSLPYMVLFFFLWIAVSLVRPVFMSCLLACLYNPVATIRKTKLFITTIQYLVGCNDKKWKEPKAVSRSAFTGEHGLEVETKILIFVRHGESSWNQTFNRGDRPKISFLLNFIPNLIYAACVEWYFFVSGKDNESWFYDAPLSEKGLAQALGVHSFLQSSIEYKTPREVELIKLMLGTSPGKSQLVSSNLRRAISTMAIGFQERLSRTGDFMLILPHLQEISCNPDALCITPPHGSVVPSWTDPDYLKPILTKHVDTSMHTGNKPVDSNGLKRMQAFCQVVFDDIDKDCIIAAGHSLWFRSFFRTYLPRELEHPAKQKKLVNGGCVAFVLKRSSGKEYMIDPSSITVLHGGF